MSDSTNIYSWSDSMRKSAIGIYRGQALLAFVTVLVYLLSYKALRLGVLGETESILAEFTQGTIYLAPLMVVMFALAPIVIGRSLQKRTARDYLNGLENQNRYLGTPLTFAISVSVTTFLLYGGLTGSILFLAGKQSYGLGDLTIFLAAIPITVAIACPIGLLVFRSINTQLDILKAQI